MFDELRQIAIFAKAIDHASFRSAAEELRLSPSVVSHHISQLEDKLGVALIYRTTRQLTLTRDGERLLESARIMLDAVETGLADLRDRSNDPSGELSLTLPSVLSKSRLVDDIAAFSLRYPKIRIHMDFSDEKKSLVKDGYDLAIRLSPSRKKAANRQSLFKIGRHLVASRSYLERHGDFAKPEELNGSDWIELEPVRMLKVVLRKQGKRAIQVAPKTSLSANDALALYRLARAGAGVAIVPDFLVDEDSDAGKVEILFPDWELDHLEAFAEWPPNAPKSGIIKLLVSELSKI